jgi:hypothetical protein
MDLVGSTIEICAALFVEFIAGTIVRLCGIMILFSLPNVLR